MEISKLVDLNNLRTAPQLSNSQEKKLLKKMNFFMITRKNLLKIKEKWDTLRF